MNRHRWINIVREERRTTRTCERCGLVRVTRHEAPRFPWTEWWRDGAQIFMSSGSPRCEPAKVDA